MCAFYRAWCRYSSSVQLDDGTILTANYCSKLPVKDTGKFRANGAPMTGPQENDPTGIVGTFWTPPPL